MPNDFPTPEELGDKLKRGDITKEEAIEVMSERARREALAGFYGPPATPARAGGEAGAWRRRGWVVAGVLLVLLTWLIWWLLPARG